MVDDTSREEQTWKRPIGRLSAEGIVNLSGSYAVCQSCSMDTPVAATKYKNHRFPVEIISHAVWLYFRFCLSFRDVEELRLNVAWW